MLTSQPSTPWIVILTKNDYCARTNYPFGSGSPRFTISCGGCCPLRLPRPWPCFMQYRESSSASYSTIWSLRSSYLMSPEKDADVATACTRSFSVYTEPMLRQPRGAHQEPEGTKEVSPSKTLLHRTTDKTKERQIHYANRHNRDDNDMGKRKKRPIRLFRFRFASVNAR